MKEHNVGFQKQLGFWCTTTQKSNRIESQGLRSTATNNINNNNEVCNVNTVNIKELSCYVYDNVLDYDESTPCPMRVANELDADFNKLLSGWSKEQRHLKLARDICKISGREFSNLKVTIGNAHYHRVLITGKIQMNEFHHNYKYKKGFAVTINGTERKLTFPWKDLVEYAQNMIFFETHFVTSHFFIGSLSSRLQGELYLSPF